jgi:hypothetical protein
LPYKLSSWVKPKFLKNYMNSLPLSQCIVTEYAGEETFDVDCKRKDIKKERDAYELIYQLLQSMPY